MASLTASGIVRPHPAGHAEIRRAVFQVSDPAAAAGHWANLFGLAVVEATDKSAVLQIGDKYYDFVKGEKNRFMQVIMDTDSGQLAGQTLRIGEGEYVFQSSHRK
ncbi:hypothetical protein D3C75_1224410 [compost metagenome]